jgi:ATP-dependent Clp protease protease subunit
MVNYKIRNAGKRSAEIYIYDAIGEMWGEGISAKRFTDDIKALGMVDLISLRINSPGGVAFEGLAIYNVLERHPARIEVDIDSMALSIASVIAMAGDEIRIAANAMMMIHNPHGVAMGTSDDLRARADVMDQMKLGLVNTYAVRTKRNQGEIANMMDDETWMTAQEAVDMGFADVVTGEVAIAASFDPHQFKNVPARFRAKARGSDTPVMDIYQARMRRLDELRTSTA